jgi:hypothetical protein
MGSCRLNTGCRMDRKQVTSTLIRVPPTQGPLEDFSMRQRRFAVAHLPITHLTAHGRLFPIAHYHDS